MPTGMQHPAEALGRTCRPGCSPEFLGAVAAQGRARSTAPSKHSGGTVGGAGLAPRRGIVEAVDQRDHGHLAVSPALSAGCAINADT